MTTPSPHQPEEWRAKYKEQFPHQSPMCTETRCRGMCQQDEILDALHTERQAAKEEVLREVHELANVQIAEAAKAYTPIRVEEVSALKIIARKHNITL